MKNLALLILLLLLCITSANAQRIIDLEVTRITKPDTVWDSKTTDYAFTIKNNGPDDIKTTDTIVYQIRYIVGIQTITFPSDVFFYNHFSPKTLKKGDSLTITGTIEQKMDVLRSTNGGVCAGAFVINETEKIKDEPLFPSTDANNSKCKDCVYYDPASPGLKVPEPEKMLKGNVSIYPNPAQKEITFKADTHTEIKEVTIKITDISGRTILQETIQVDNAKSITITKNITAYAAGLYLVEINTNTAIFTGKFIKQQ